MKRGVIIGDLYCGHVSGLTPPAWQSGVNNKSTTKRNKWAELQRSLWVEYKKLLKKYGPFDFGFSLGDAIDGKGSRSGSVECITADRSEQADIAVSCHDQVRLHARKGFEWVGVHGTSYHTGAEGEDWDSKVAKDAGFKKMGAHEWVDVNGVVFDLKHHLGSSGIPHGRHTAVARDRLQNMLWSERELQPKADVILRAHVHYHNYCGGPGWVAMTIPALQGMGTRYGARRCSGLVDWGITVFEVDKDGGFDWHCETVTIQAQKAKVVKI